MQLDAILTRIEQAQQVTSDDVLDMRREVFSDNFVAWNEAERLLAIHRMAIDKAESWTPFMVAAMTTFLVRQSKPAGYVEEPTAKWFIEQVAPTGFIESDLELQILQSVLNEAKDATATLVEFALEQVKAAILGGSGHMGRSRSVGKKVIGREDVQIIEKILYASGGDGQIAVTEKEAEVLFDINDACTATEAAAADWQSLFVNGITNSVMFCSIIGTPTRADVKHAERWISERGDLGVFNHMNEATPQKVWDSFSGQDFKQQKQRYLIDKEIMARSERIDEGEALWLARRIARDGVLSENERALLRHLGKMCPDIHPSLIPFIEAA